MPNASFFSGHAWLADVTAVAMVFFSLSGLWRFFAPRMEKTARFLKKRAAATRHASPKRQDA